MKVKLNKQLFSEWLNAKKLSDSLEDQITSRIDYILRFLYKTFGGELDYWYFPNAEEGQVGDLYKYTDANSVNQFVFEEVKAPEEIEILDKNGKYYSLFDGNEIPIRWLFEDFEQEVIGGAAAYKEQEKKKLELKKEKFKLKKEEQKALAESAKNKLTKEELKALKSTL